MITIIDYGVGNINAFYNIYKNLGISVKVAKSSKDLTGASKLILPGVGHFDYAMSKFKDSGMIDNVTEMVLNNNIPILGICVGMQMLAQSSEEGVLPGLGWIDGEVKKIDSSLLKQTTRLPHMGWNDINVRKQTPLFTGLENSSKFYFLHSYYFNCHNNQDIISSSFYGEDFTSSVNYLNIFGVQFHPEKSHNNGIKLLENFSKL
jgi:glutamine amidotransferase